MVGFRQTWLFILSLLASASLSAQEEPVPEEEHSGHHEAGMPSMNMSGTLGISMMRDASGTSWQPDSAPMAMIMLHLGDWTFMFHSNIFVGLDAQSSSRGDTQFNSINWLMAGVSGPVGPGRATVRAMLSLEPLTMTGNGYPLLFQTGETWQGEHLHDRQHPHDLFMELALRYSLPILDDLALDFYIAPSGEPALGPTAFPHRVSARSNPLAPLGHHWYDSTHISFGVLTFGVFGSIWKAEASWFNGREPDENRYGIDLRVPDAFSARFTINPFSMLSAQVSYGYLNSPEASEPDVSLHKLTTSASLNLSLWPFSNIAATAMIGLNMPKGGSSTYFGLAEAEIDVTRQHTVFGRVEGGTKTGADLVLQPNVADIAYGTAAFSLGYTYNFPSLWKIETSVGGVGTLYTTGSEPGTYYGGEVQCGGMVFVRLRLNDSI